MNTLAHLACMIALLWLSVYCFGTLDINALGYAALGLFLLMIPLTVVAALEDWHVLHGGKERREED